MPHKHDYTIHSCTTLTLPGTDGRYELLQGFTCACGAGLSCTSYAKNTGRHQTLAELQAIKRREAVKPQRTSTQRRSAS